MRSGNYGSSSEAIRQALQLLAEQELFLAANTYRIRAQIAEGLESLERGERVDGEQVFDRLEAELDAREALGKR